MSINRYSVDSKIGFGSQFGTPQSVISIRKAIRRGDLPIISTITLTGDDRLDSLAGSIYGDARYWWILAAASDIGWGLQVPPGTLINVVDLRKLEEFLV